jgi:hypothetical protein
MQVVGTLRMSMEQSKEDLDRPIWGVKAIAKAANLTARQTYHALEKGYLPASKAVLPTAGCVLCLPVKKGSLQRLMLRRHWRDRRPWPAWPPHDRVDLAQLSLKRKRLKRLERVKLNLESVEGVRRVWAFNGYYDKNALFCSFELRSKFSSVRMPARSAPAAASVAPTINARTPNTNDKSFFGPLSTGAEALSAVPMRHA